MTKPKVIPPWIKELRGKEPELLTEKETRALAVHEWIGAPPGWKARVLARLSEYTHRHTFDPLNDETKDELYDKSNNIMHEAAHVWQLLEQGDTELAVEALDGIRVVVNSMLTTIEDFAKSNPEETAP